MCKKWLAGFYRDSENVEHRLRFTSCFVFKKLARGRLNLSLRPNTRLQRTPLRVEQDRAFFSASICYNVIAIYQQRRR